MKELSKPWISADLHLGHKRMIDLAGRPPFFDRRIIENHIRHLRETDIFICAGDFCIGNDQMWHDKFLKRLPCRKWLVRGNHDRKTDTWYLSNGWDFVGEAIVLKKYGLKIIITHAPVLLTYTDYDINVHGHLHSPGRHEEYESIISKKHRLVSSEHSYTPHLLRTVVGK